MAAPEAGVGRGIDTGPNSRPLNDTVASTGPGIPDDALAAGETLDDALPSGTEDLSTEQLADQVFGTGEDSGAAPDPDEPEGHPS